MRLINLNLAPENSSESITNSNFLFLIFTRLSVLTTENFIFVGEGGGMSDTLSPRTKNKIYRLVLMVS